MSRACEGPYRFFIYSQDCGEPPHVHISRDQQVAKFWLDPVELVSPGRFTGHELRDIERIIREHHEELMTKWQARCS